MRCCTCCVEAYDKTKTAEDEAKVFHVDHIASFNASSASRPSSESSDAAGSPATPITLLLPNEAMRRLRQLALHRGLWTTHVTLVVGGHQLVVIDPLTCSTMEQFPMSLIYRPVAVRGTPGDLYDNVAMVTVLGDAKQKTVPEVHVFQCIDQQVSECQCGG